MLTKWLPWAGFILAIAYISLNFYQEHTKQKIEDTKVAAIENPTEVRHEVVERVITKVVERPTGEVERTKTVERIGSSLEKRAEVPANKVSGNDRRWYLSVCAGPDISQGDFTDLYYGGGAGYYFTDALSGGIRYDQFRQGHRVSVELGVRF